MLAPVALGAAWLGGTAFALLVLVAAAGMGWEWARLTGCAEGALGTLIIVAAMVPTLAMALAGVRLAMALVIAAAAAIWLAARRGDRPAALWAGLGVAWIALPCAAVLALSADRDAGRAAILWLFATVWATDTGAYAAGRAIGGPRLAPRISPNKTWSGFLGGLCAAGLVAWATARLTGAAAGAVIPAGLAMSVAAQIGDLAESLAKRRFGVKDAGHLIPGHGGLLDRLDGMLTAAALQWLLTLACGASPLQWPA